MNRTVSTQPRGQGFRLIISSGISKTPNHLRAGLKVAPKPLYGADDHILLPRDGSIHVVRSSDDSELLGGGARSLKEITGMGNWNNFVLFRMDDQRWTFVARKVANGLDLKRILDKARADFAGVEFAGTRLTRNPPGQLLDQVAQSSRMRHGAPEHHHLGPYAGRESCGHGSSQGKSQQADALRVNARLPAQEGHGCTPVSNLSTEGHSAKFAVRFPRPVEVKSQGGDFRLRQGSRALYEHPMRFHAVAGKSVKQHHPGRRLLQRGGGQMQHTPQCFAREVGELQGSLNSGILHRGMTS